MGGEVRDGGGWGDAVWVERCGVEVRDGCVGGSEGVGAPQPLFTSPYQPAEALISLFESRFLQYVNEEVLYSVDATQLLRHSDTYPNEKHAAESGRGAEDRLPAHGAVSGLFLPQRPARWSEVGPHMN